MTPAEQAFNQRYLTWETLHRHAGAGRSYPHAWRLPEWARPLGQASLHRAENALALDLYTLGRFREARGVLSPANSSPRAQALRCRIGLLLDEAPDTPGREGSPMEAAYLAYLADRPGAWRHEVTANGNESDRLWGDVLWTWAEARLEQHVSLAASHRALAALRVLDPSLAAQAEALQAETMFRLDPRWAVVWLDHALARSELFAQHHLKARLLGLKAQALEAAGELGEGARFRKLARALALRQEAALYLRLFIEPA